MIYLIVLLLIKYLDFEVFYFVLARAFVNLTIAWFCLIVFGFDGFVSYVLINLLHFWFWFLFVGWCFVCCVVLLICDFCLWFGFWFCFFLGLCFMMFWVFVLTCWLAVDGYLIICGCVNGFCVFRILFYCYLMLLVYCLVCWVFGFAYFGGYLVLFLRFD